MVDFSATTDLSFSLYRYKNAHVLEEEIIEYTDVLFQLAFFHILLDFFLPPIKWKKAVHKSPFPIDQFILSRCILLSALFIPSDATYHVSDSKNNIVERWSSNFDKYSKISMHKPTHGFSALE